jgi:hypothetical protein
MSGAERMSWRRRLLLAAALVATAAALLAGCGSATYEPGDPQTVKQAITDAGGTIVDQGTLPTRFAGETAVTWLEVSGPGAQSSGKPGLLVGVLQFENERYRDAAFSALLYRMQRLGKGVVMTWADSVIVLARVTDRGLLSKMVRTLKDIGAK